jgi:hypothetical protein
MVAIDQQIAGAAIDAVFRKLMCALHYKHTGNILPADGTITVKWCTNAALSAFMTDDMKAFVADLTEKPTLARNGKDLSDQFDYRYRTSDDGNSSMYFIKFRQSIFGAGIVTSKPERWNRQPLRRANCQRSAPRSTDPLRTVSYRLGVVLRMLFLLSAEASGQPGSIRAASVAPLRWPSI